MNRLHSLMNPGSIATVGAGNNPMKMGTMHALSIVKGGFTGKYYPVHPRDEKVLGFRAYRNIADLPEPPDLAVIVVPTDLVPGILEEFGKLGTKNAIIISAGFKETGADGHSQEKRLLETADAYGMRFIGPNCIGIINTSISLNTTVLSINNSPGKLGFLSQSGTYVAQSLSYLNKKGIRFSKAMSLGNEANVNMVDALEYLGDDEDTRAIALYIEGIREGARFIEVARRITPRKPVIAQYVGGSSAGARSGLSHTGAMAGPDHLYDGVFRQCGIIRVDSVEELYGFGFTLANQPPLRGNRVGIVTNSGGPGTSIANTCENGGMEVPKFSEKLQSELRKIIASHSPCGNPVDITFSMDISLLTEKIPELVIQSGDVDGIVLHGAMLSGYLRAVYPNLKDSLGGMPLETLLEQVKIDLKRAIEIPASSAIPMTVSSFFDHDDDYTRAYQEGGIPVFDSPEKAARAMVMLEKYRRIRLRTGIEKKSLPAVSDIAAAVLREAREANRKTLDEHQSKKLLAAYGIPVVPEFLTMDPGEAMAMAKKIGYPLALKGCSADISHKTEMGLVILDVKNDEELFDAFKSIRRTAGERTAVLLQKMIGGRRELMCGMTRFDGFGPAVVFGRGGVFTEVEKDNTFRIAPLLPGDPGEMIDELRCRKMLGAYRGMEAADTGALERIIATVGDIAILHPEIAEMDINPVIISGGKPVAVDALVVLRD